MGATPNRSQNPLGIHPRKSVSIGIGATSSQLVSKLKHILIPRLAVTRSQVY